ncbi:MAG: histidine phosphatase family protein [Roseburia sp.]|nr:histidine phosphatase family protein [Roseburia sp.]
MLYIARHGQTIWNAQNKVCGITDVELTDEAFFYYTLKNGELEEYKL